MIDIRAFRKANNISQKQLAEVCKVTQGAVSQWESGLTKIPSSTLDMLLNNTQGWDVTSLVDTPPKGKIPLYDTASIGGVNEMTADMTAVQPAEWINAGDWFPKATSAIYHYGDSMNEYPSGCILVLKRVNNPSLLVNGENYVIETDEFRITKQLQDDGDSIIAYSTNNDTYPDGRIIHAPIRIPKEEIRHLDLVLGCVIKSYNTPIKIR